MGTMRRLKRGVAKANMRREGFTQICKKDGEHSFFANNWRDYAKAVKMEPRRATQRGRGYVKP